MRTLVAENKEDRAGKTASRPEIIQFQWLPHVEDRERDEHGEGDHLLHDLKLAEVVRSVPRTIGVRRRITDNRFVDLLWRFLKAGHIEKDLFRASSEGVCLNSPGFPVMSIPMDQLTELRSVESMHLIASQ